MIVALRSGDNVKIKPMLRTFIDLYEQPPVRIKGEKKFLNKDLLHAVLDLTEKCTGSLYMMYLPWSVIDDAEMQFLVSSTLWILTRPGKETLRITFVCKILLVKEDKMPYGILSSFTRRIFAHKRNVRSNIIYKCGKSLCLVIKQAYQLLLMLNEDKNILFHHKTFWMFYLCVNVRVDEHNRPIIIQQGGIPLLIAVLKRNQDQPRILERVCAALANISLEGK